MDTSPGFLTVAELADLARVSQSFIRKEIARGGLPSVMFGTTHRIRRAVAEAFLRGGAVRSRRLRAEVTSEFRDAARVR
jgi:excisionase family DNA binding protein